MYLIDTDVLIWVLRGNKKYTQFLLKLKDEDVLSISTITIAEIYKNIYPAEMVKTENLINEFQILEINVSIAKQAGLYWQQYAGKFTNLSLTDCLIAAAANVADAALVSLNLKHFPMRDIRFRKAPK